MDNWMYLLIGAVVAFLGCAYCISEIMWCNKMEREIDKIIEETKRCELEINETEEGGI